MKNHPSPPPEFIKNIIFSLGSRGGVGKTFLMALLWGWLLSKVSRCRALDLDTENAKRGGLSSFVPLATRIDMHTPAGLDQILDTAQGEENVIIADMPAASAHLALPWFEDMHPFCEELKLRLVFMCLITDFAGTVENTLTWADRLQDKVDYVVVLNPGADPAATFSFWKHAKQAQEFREAFHPAEITLPSIRRDVMPHLEESKLTLHTALELATLPAAINRYSIHCRITKWRDQVFRQFDSIQSILLP